MFKINNENTRTKSVTPVWSFYSSLWKYLPNFCSVYIVDFEQLNVSWLVIPIIQQTLQNTESVEINTKWVK